MLPPFETIHFDHLAAERGFNGRFHSPISPFRTRFIPRTGTLADETFQAQLPCSTKQTPVCLWDRRPSSTAEAEPDYSVTARLGRVLFVAPDRQRIRSESGSGRHDLNVRPPGPKPGALPS
jgi:hypothetical protein